MVMIMTMPQSGMSVDAEYIQRQSFCIIHTLSYKFEEEDDFHDIMMDTINDIQKRNGYFYISSLVKACDVNCSINNKNMVKKAQINMAGIEMNLLIAGLMMIMMVKVDVTSCLFRYKIAMYYIAIQNIFGALLNISLTEELDGEHTISSLMGVSVVDALPENTLRQVFEKESM